MDTKHGLIKQGSTFTMTVLEKDNGLRVDKYIAQEFTQYSRSFLQELFDQHQILLHPSKPLKPSYKIKTNDIISITFPAQDATTSFKHVPDSVGVSIIAKENDFFIINKPAHLIVHPPHGLSKEITLSDWLKQTYEEICHVGAIDRPGIVHRLDKDTSGLMIIPRTNAAHAELTSKFKARTIKKTYLAIVMGHPQPSGTIDYFIGRHPTVKNKMHHFTELTKQSSSREAITDYTVLQYYKDFSLVEAKPHTGRTHQIRVHFAALGHPILGDQLYGSKSKLTKRQALHAHALAFELHGISYTFTSPLDQELQKILDQAEKI